MGADLARVPVESQLKSTGRSSKVLPGSVLPGQDDTRVVQRTKGMLTSTTSRIRQSFENVWADLRYAVRSLSRTPGFVLSAMSIFGVGIGVNVAVFTIANATLFKGFNGPTHQERLVYVTTGRDCCISYLDLADWRAESTTIAGLGAVADLRVAFDAGQGPETVTATEITANTFALLGVGPELGRDFTAAD